MDEALPEQQDEETLQPYSLLELSCEVVHNGQSRSERLELQEGKPLLIGRKDNKLDKQICALVLDNGDKSTSRKQARLTWSDGKVYLLDLSTYSNTLVNGQKIPHEKENAEGVQLSSGDRIQMSNHTVTSTWESNPYA